MGAAGLPPGFRWPAEWERHEATWLSWPHNPDTWPGCLREAEREYVEIVRALAGRERVRINVRDARMEEAVRRTLAGAGVADSGVDFYAHPTNDAWVRDHGAIFAVREAADGRARERLALDFLYDAWVGMRRHVSVVSTVPAPSPSTEPPSSTKPGSARATPSAFAICAGIASSRSYGGYLPPQAS